MQPSSRYRFSGLAAVFAAAPRHHVAMWGAGVIHAVAVLVMARTVFVLRHQSQPAVSSWP
jgi:hypothetical protein